MRDFATQKGAVVSIVIVLHLPADNLTFVLNVSFAFFSDLRHRDQYLLLDTIYVRNSAWLGIGDYISFLSVYLYKQLLALLAFLLYLTI